MNIGSKNDSVSMGNRITLRHIGILTGSHVETESKLFFIILNRMQSQSPYFTSCICLPVRRQAIILNIGFIVNWTLGNKFQRIFNQQTTFFYQRNSILIWRQRNGDHFVLVWICSKDKCRKFGIDGLRGPFY